MKHQLDESPVTVREKVRRLESEKHAFSMISLLDLSAMSVAAHLPFEYIEASLNIVPEPVQERILYFSFPRDSADIKTYSSFMSYKFASNDKSPFVVGKQLFEKNCVDDVIQIGFHLTGVVKPDVSFAGPLDVKTYKVSMTFDRCKIISVYCSCNSRGLSWCSHAVALSLFRINKADFVHFRAPISDTLVKMDRSQLQKFAQYLIASHPNRVLASAQKLADKLLQQDSQINRISGAPDPTSGGGLNDPSTWYFDEIGVREQLRLDLAAVATYGATTYIVSTSTDLSPHNVPLASSFTVNGRVFQSGLIDLPRYRFSRPTHYVYEDLETVDEASVTKNRSSGNRSFAQVWLENYRLLQRSKLAPFGYTSFGSATSHSNNNNTPASSSLTNLGSGLSNSAYPSTNNNALTSIPLSTVPSMNQSTATTSSSCPPHSHFPGSQVAMVFAKTYELLAARDSNGPRLLAIITEELLNSANLMVVKGRRSYRGGALSERGNWDSFIGDLEDDLDELDGHDAPQRPQTATIATNRPSPSWAIPLWEEIARLWACILLSPGIPAADRESWRERLVAWSLSTQAPRDDIYFIPPPTNPPAAENLTSEAVTSPLLIRPPSRTTVGREPTSVFQLALDASALSVEVTDEFPAIPRNALANLARTLPANVRQCTCPYCGISLVISRASGVNENFVASCLRVPALQVTGFSEDATRLAVSLANALLGCLEEVGRIGISSGQCSPPSPVLPPPPSVNFMRTASATSSKPGNPASSLTVNTSCGGGGGPIRVGFRSPPPPSQQHSATFYHRHYQQQHPYLLYSPPSPSGSRGPHPYHQQIARCRYFQWQRTPQRADSHLLYCSSEASNDCPFHEYGWLGLPGRPIISLVECLLEAAANKFEDSERGGMTASDYIRLALKIGIVALCQQRSLPSNSGALLASQAQEMRLILLLNTIPRDATTAQIVGHLSCQLMGPSSTSPAAAAAAGSPHETWWSALGPVVHPDTYPVHIVAELLFGHLLAGETAGINTGELAYLVAARSMRLPVLEPGSDSPLLAMTYSTSAAQRLSDGSTRLPSYVSINATPVTIRSPPLPSTFATVALSGSGSLSNGTSIPSARLPPPPPPPSTFHHRPVQESARDQHHHLHPHPALNNQESVAAAYRRDLGAMEGRQARLAISLILASRSAVFRMDHFMRVCDRHIHTAMSLLSVSREVLAEAIGHRLHSSTTAFSLDDPSLLTNTVSTTSTSASGNLGFSDLLPVNFITTPLPTTSLQERVSLVCAAFHLALSVAIRTAWPRVHWRRREMLGWAVSTGLLAGPLALLHLVQAWTAYASPREAVTWLAPTLLACVACVSPLGGGGGGGKSARGGGGDVGVQQSANPRIYSFLAFTPSAVEQIKAAVRQMTIQAAAQDPVNCALTALQLTEQDTVSFEATYRLVVDAAKAGSLGPTHLFSAARHLDARGFPLWAFPLTVHATRLFSLSGLQESHPVANDVLWSCLLAHRIGPSALQEILTQVVRNVHCPILLADILHRFRSPPPPTPPPPSSRIPCHSTNRPPYQLTVDYHQARPVDPPNYATYYMSPKQSQTILPLDAPPLKALLDATISAFVTTTHTRLANISPRQYSEFVDFLTRARDTFGLLKPDGPAQFRQLVSCLCHSYRGKRKLVSLLNERFRG